MTSEETVDDIWSSMMAETAKDIAAEKLRSKLSHVTSNKSKSKRSGAGSVKDMISLALARESKQKQKKKTKKASHKVVTKSELHGLDVSTRINNRDPDGSVSSTDVPSGLEDDVTGNDQRENPEQTMKQHGVTIVTIDATEMMIKIARDMSNVSNMDNQMMRRNALISINTKLFVENRLSADGYSNVFREICKPIFQRFVDPVEKCREMAYKISYAFFENATNLTPVIGYFIPALVARISPCIAFDEEMKVFVQDMEQHEEYRRGKAVDRADKLDYDVHSVVEVSEEIRLLACKSLLALIKTLCDLDAGTILHPYFHDIIMFVQSQLRDPYSEIKIIAFATLELLCSYEDFTAGMKFFAVALCRAIFPVMRHRHAKVRAMAIVALTCCMCVPDRAKLKGSGTESIIDLVGFKEENVLSVASFYKSDTQLNYLAEVAQDSAVNVRKNVALMLSKFLTELGDRYDHQTRLLPYILDLLCDENEEVAEIALTCIEKCGQQYEEEHQDEIMERRQYGVDGDCRINLDKPYPKPFRERPRLGQRLYVRGNCKRFLGALVGELTNWMGKTRLKSANLLKMVVVFMEEHITMEAHTLLPAFIKALGFAKDDNDIELQRVLLDTYEIVGRFILPELYVHFILPRLRGDPKVIQFGVDSSTRMTVMEFLQALLSGSRAKEISPFFEDIVFAMTDPFVISRDSTQLMKAAMRVMYTLLNVMFGHGKATIEAQFLNTGRLRSLQMINSKAFRWLFTSLCVPSTQALAMSCLKTLAKFDRDSVVLEVVDSSNEDIRNLFVAHGVLLLDEFMSEFDCSAENWLDTNSDRFAFTQLIEAPWAIVSLDVHRYCSLLDFLCDCINGKRGNYDSQLPDALDFLVKCLESVLVPTLYEEIFPNHNQIVTFKGLFKVPQSNSEKVFWPGSIQHGKEHASILIIKLREKIPEILDCFVLNGRWEKTVTLQKCRLRILATLLGLSPLKNTTDETAPLISTENIVINDDLLAKSLSLSCHSSTSVEIRLLGVNTARILLNLLIRTFISSSSTRILQSFTEWKVACEGDKAKRVLAQNIAQRTLAALVHLLDDADDNVRTHVLLTFKSAVPLLKEDYKETSMNDATTVDAKYFHFGLLQKRLISLLLEENENSEALIAVDDTLRCISVLDPGAMEKVVEEAILKLPVLTSDQRNFKQPLPRKHDILAGLLDHCTVLSKFAVKTRS